jgi:hypothetical protein
MMLVAELLFSKIRNERKGDILGGMNVVVATSVFCWEFHCGEGEISGEASSGDDLFFCE